MCVFGVLDSRLVCVVVVEDCFGERMNIEKQQMEEPSGFLGSENAGRVGRVDCQGRMSN